MKRALHILGMFALCMVIIATPNRAYALSFTEEQLLGGMMNDYQGNIWDEDVPWYQSTYYSLQNSLTNNAQLALLWEGAASKAALFLSMNDYLRATFAATYGCYGILDSYMSNINSKINTMQGDIEDIRVDVSTLPGLVTAISNKTSEILTKTETISGDLLTLTQNVSTIGNTLAGNQGQQLSKLTDIKTLLTSIDNTLTEGQNITVNAPDVTVSTTDYTGQIADVRNKLTVINGTLTENQNLLSDINDTLAQGQNITVTAPDVTVNATDYSTVLDEIKTLLQDGFNVVVNVPETVVNVPDEVKISNWPPYDMPVSYDYSEVLGNIETMLTNGLTVNVGNWPESFVDLTATNELLSSIDSRLDTLYKNLYRLCLQSDYQWSISGLINQIRTQLTNNTYQTSNGIANTIKTLLRHLVGDVNNVLGENKLVGLDDVIKAINNISIPSLSNVESLLADIKNLLKVQNMGDTIGEFDWLLFRQNADNLNAHMANTMPFGVLDVFTALLGLIQATPVDNPSFTVPFDFSGANQSIVIDVSWLADLRSLISFVCVLAWLMILANVTHDYFKGEVAG